MKIKKIFPWLNCEVYQATVFQETHSLLFKLFNGLQENLELLDKTV